MRKKLATLLVCILLIQSLGSVVIAAEKKEIYKENPDRYIEMKDYETGEIKYHDKYLKISNDGWDFMKEKFTKGQILVTDDAKTLGYSHGHSAILVNSTHTVEHLGSNTTKYSGYYDVSWWQTFDTIKSFNYNNSTIMRKAADYAKSNLQNKRYNFMADRTSSRVNCATLVWKAYNSQGVNIVNSTSGTVKPSDFDKSRNLNWVRSIGWNKVSW